MAGHLPGEGQVKNITGHYECQGHSRANLVYSEAKFQNLTVSRPLEPSASSSPYWSVGLARDQPIDST